MSRTFTFTRSELYGLVWTRPLNALASEFGISGNAMAKICDRLLVPHPARGFWSRTTERAFTRPPLPPSPSPAAERVTISAERAASRRTRTRKSSEVRRDQIIAATADLVRTEGLNAISMKRVAQEVGISETLVYNYFSSPTDLLATLARIEIADMTDTQDAAMSGVIDYSERARASAASYLRYIERRGGLLQILLSSPEVRSALRGEYQERRVWNSQSMATKIASNYELDLTMASAGTAMLRSVPVRAGKLLGAGKINLAIADRLTHAIAGSARARLIEVSKRARRGGPD
jgi:AcrR family transcriptional regulator